MSKDKKADNSVKNITVVVNDDRGLSPVSSGTPMPKVMPATKPSSGQQSQSSSSKKKSEQLHPTDSQSYAPFCALAIARFWHNKSYALPDS